MVQWYVDFVISKSTDSLIVDHLERKTNDITWQQPTSDDIQRITMIQIVPCPVEGDWEFSCRVPQFVVKGSESIIEKFK